MELDIVVHRNSEEVHQAIIQFAARRSYRLRQPWHIEGLRIEAPPAAISPRPSRGGDMFGLDLGNLEFWDSGEKPARIDVIIRRKSGKTRLKIGIGKNPESTKLAYELHSYLLDERSYDAACPPMCARCGTPVRNVLARYCGRCGQKLVMTEQDAPPAPAVRPKSTKAAVAVAAPPSIRVPAVKLGEASSAFERPVVVERDAEPAATTDQPIEETHAEPPEDDRSNAIETRPDDETPEEVEPACEEDDRIAGKVEAEVEDDEPDEAEESPPRRLLAED